MNNYTKEEIDARLSTLATKEDVKNIVVEAIEGYFVNKGALAKRVIIGTAVVVGALAVIGGGLKTLLAWIGITIMRQ